MTTWPATRRSSRNASRILRVGLTLAVAGVAQANQPSNASEVLGWVMVNQGKTQLFRPGSVTAGLRASVPLRAGDILKTADGDAAALSLTPGIAVWLPERSELKVEELRMGEGDETVEERFAQVRLERGTAMFSVGSPEDRKVELRILMPSIEVGAEPGSVFSVSALEGGSGQRLLCAAGAVYWRDGARAQRGCVLGGQFQDCGAGAPSVPRSISSDRTAQLATLALLDSARVLSELAGKLPSVLIPRTVKAGKDEILMK